MQADQIKMKHFIPQSVSFLNDRSNLKLVTGFSFSQPGNLVDFIILVFEVRICRDGRRRIRTALPNQSSFGISDIF